MRQRVVFDTTTVVSALLFSSGRLAWLRQHWSKAGCVPLISRATVEELMRVFRYPKFGLHPDDLHELLADYLPHCEVIDPVQRCPVKCRDRSDQPFLDLAHTGKADSLVSGDRDLLVLSRRTRFLIESPEAYRLRVSGAE